MNEQKATPTPKPPPNGWTRFSRRLLMVGSTVIILGWFVGWITGWSDREPTVIGLMFLGGLALTATSGGDHLIKQIIEAVSSKGKSNV